LRCKLSRCLARQCAILEVIECGNTSRIVFLTVNEHNGKTGSSRRSRGGRCSAGGTGVVSFKEKREKKKGKYDKYFLFGLQMKRERLGSREKKKNDKQGEY